MAEGLMAAYQEKEKTLNVSRLYSPIFEAFNIFKIYIIRVMHLIVFISSLQREKKLMSGYSFGDTHGEPN